MSERPGAAGLSRVLARAADRLERNGLSPTGRLNLTGLGEPEIRALSGLLGARWRPVLPGSSASVDLAALEAAIRASPRFPGGLVAACTQARGAVLVDRRATRLTAAGARERGWAGLRAHPALERHRELATWLDRERSTGSAARTGGGDPFGVLGRALDVLAALPADPPQTLARFAATRCGGDAHALDRDRPLDSTVRRALAHLDGDRQSGTGSEARRARYDRWGLGSDELSSTVLCHGIWPGASQPRVLTLRELRGVGALPCGSTVLTCENPDVVAAAADALGSACPPLVCTNGWPSSACVRLLRATIAGGATASHHGDMDPEGLRILDRLIATTGGRPWRMSPVDYLRHADAGAALTGGYAGAATLNDAALAALAQVMAQTGRIVQEEQTITALLDDLRAAWRSRPATVAAERTHRPHRERLSV